MGMFTTEPSMAFAVGVTGAPGGDGVLDLPSFQADLVTTPGEHPPADASMSIEPNPDSFEAFFAAEYPTLARGLTLALGDAELGRDAASEGFVRALQRWNKIQKYDNPAGWVYRVGLNWARSRRRKTVREIRSRPADRAVETSEHDPALAQALQSLSADHRMVVVARYYLDWSEAETAEALNVKVGTVKSRLSRALDQLEQHLSQPFQISSPNLTSEQGA